LSKREAFDRDARAARGRREGFHVEFGMRAVTKRCESAEFDLAEVAFPVPAAFDRRQDRQFLEARQRVVACLR
jgi:hypothetical protein